MTVTSLEQGSVAPQPFRIAVEEATLLDLKRRLDATRWPDEVSESDWTFGTDLRYLKSVVDYWRSDYDWREQEKRLNRFRQFTVRLDDVDVHFIHEQGEGSAPLPLLLTHGWPGSIVEFHELIPLLTHPSAHGGEVARRVHDRGALDSRIRLFVPPEPATFRSCGRSPIPSSV